MNDGFKNRFFKLLTAVVVLTILVIGMVCAWPYFVRGRALKRKDAELALRIEEKKTEIARLQDYQRRFRSDSEFVELIARQNHRVYPGELVFIFEDR